MCLCELFYEEINRTGITGVKDVPFWILIQLNDLQRNLSVCEDRMKLPVAHLC